MSGTMRNSTPMADKYLNFPIPLLQDAFSDIRKTMNDIMRYAGYAHTPKLVYGNKYERIEAAGRYFGITFGNVNSVYTEGKTLHDSLPSNSPMTGISTTICFDFYENHKRPDEIAVLLAYLAIKSAIGAKPYTKLTNEYSVARMGGYANIKDMPNPLPNPLLKYYTRRKLDKIKQELQLNWNVNIYSIYTRGFYVSIDNKFSLDKLVFEAEKRRKSTKEKQLKQKKENARKRALEALKDSNDLEF